MNVNDFEKYTHEAAKKAFEGKPLSDESVEKAILDMRGRIANGELTPDVYQNKERGVLSFVKEVMHLNVTRLKLRKKKMARLSLLLTCLLMILTLSIGIPVYQNNVWKSMLTINYFSFSSLEKKPILSLDKYNKKMNSHFYWLDNVEKVNTFMYYYDNQTVMIEESYLYDDIPITLYIVNKNSSIEEFNRKFENPNSIIVNNQKIRYESSSDEIFGYFYKFYTYYIIIPYSNVSILEPILSNLTKN